MEQNEVSRHEIEVLRVLCEHQGEWITNANILNEVHDVKARTVSHHTRRLVDLGIVDQVEVFPHHRFRLASKARSRNRGYFDRLHVAAEVLGVSLTKA